MRIVERLFTKNNIMFCDISDSLSSLNQNVESEYPFHEEVRNWFLSISQFSIENKEKYESIYQENKEKIIEFIHEHAEELIKTIFLFDGDVDDKDKLN